MPVSCTTKISITVVSVVALAVLGSICALLTAHHVQGMAATVIARDIPAARASIELGNALGTLASQLPYVLEEGNRLRRSELEGTTRQVERRLDELRGTIRGGEAQRQLIELEKAYRSCVAKLQAARALPGDRRDAAEREALVRETVRHAEAAGVLAQRLVATNLHAGASAAAGGHRRIKHLTIALVLWASVMIGLGASLLSLLFGSVILPLRQLAAEAGPGPTSPVPSPPQAEEIQALCANIHSLRSDLADLSALLTESRSQLTNCQHLASVGKLAACLAHEIRNPLTSMKMWAFAIRREAGEHPELQNKSLMLAREISRLQHLLMNYLDFARPPQPRQTRLGVVALIDETLELLDHRIARGHLRVVRGNGVRVPPVLADAQQLKQVFLNILDNAADAMPEGGEIRITPSVEIGPDGRTMVILRFQDTGPGLPPAVRDRLFVPFVSTKERGTGLGLSIAAGIVANHGGQLALESSSPQGTTFAVRLPSWTREDQQA